MKKLFRKIITLSAASLLSVNFAAAQEETRENKSNGDFTTMPSGSVGLKLDFPPFDFPYQADTMILSAWRKPAPKLMFYFQTICSAM